MGAVAPLLAEESTVITSDRRGFSRSPRPHGWTASSVTEQADDAAALLRALDLAPAVVVGHSAGGSIACSLVAGHPELVRHAVLYEPALLAVVPGGEEIVGGMRAAGEQAMAEGGPRRAMEGFMRGNVGDEMVDQWLALADPAERDRVLDNGAVFFPVELPWVATFVPDRDGMGASGVPLTVAAGADNRDTPGWGPRRPGWPRGPAPTGSSCPAGTSGSSPTRRSSSGAPDRSSTGPAATAAAGAAWPAAATAPKPPPTASGNANSATAPCPGRRRGACRYWPPTARKTRWV